MRIRSRRYLFRLTLCIPFVWFFIALIVLQSNELTEDSIDDPASLDTDVDKRIEWTINPLHAIDLVKQIIRSIFNNKQIEDVQNQAEQTIALQGLGEMGKAVGIDKNRLTPKAARKYDEGFKKHSFNQYVSDLISKHRTLPDVRDPGCRQIQYQAPPITASIVMCFHNEAWSVLLRSIHSIIDRSPSHLLKEIILVDDFSDLKHLKRPLDNYLKNLTMVSVIRQTKREGLIRSRLVGAARVKGDAIIFLDSHIEVTEGWLEPLLDPISRNRTIVVTPLIDIIDDKTFKYTAAKIDPLGIGGFNWNLQFSWHILPERERKARKNPLELTRSPTMAGGLFAISKSYFEDLGTYDAGMDIWGGENLEISFRIWMCGGTLLTVPCSHVGHIFRQTSPYTWLPNVNIVKKNAVRLAEVWLDEYKKYYYERIDYNLENYGDVGSRKLLRQKLQCKSFKWYLTEIYPGLYIPKDSIALGEIRNVEAHFCVDGNTDHGSFNRSVIGFLCHGQGGNQFFMLSLAGEIRRDDGCLGYAGGKVDANKNDKVIVNPCHRQKGDQRWIYNENNQIYHPVSDLCMALSDDPSHIQMQACDLNNEDQRWLWKRKLLNETDRTQ